MWGGRSTGSSLLPLPTAPTIVVGITVILLVVGWVGPTASKAGSLGVCQWVRTGISKVLAGMDLTGVLKEETLVQVSETGSGNGTQGGNFLCQTKTRVETLAPTELEGGIPETKMEADGVSLGFRQERLSATVTQTTTPFLRETPQVQPGGYLPPPC